MRHKLQFQEITEMDVLLMLSLSTVHTVVISAKLNHQRIPIRTMIGLHFAQEKRRPSISVQISLRLKFT